MEQTPASLQPWALRLVTKKIEPTNLEKFSALYLAILEMPNAYVKFIELRGFQSGYIIRGIDLKNAWAEGARCGVYPFC